MKHDYRVIAWRPAQREDGTIVNLQLEIDQGDILTWMGAKALRSKRGYSQIASGAVRVRVVKK
ncbi:MAG TPA: hypothetical protein VFP71_03085 [Candidatus Angelobacter sp.]|nr:hypothetical protein [Candidatus Angelobacter sp.]